MSRKHQARAEDRFLRFSMGKEDFAMPLLQVREVIAVPEVTPVPFTPSHVLGVMNLRGQVISVFDLRKKFGITPNESVEKAVIICDLAPLCIGMLVDSITSVLSPTPEQLSENPEIQTSLGKDLITHVHTENQKLTLIIDIAKALSVEDRIFAAKAA
jgi:purine-binding chemotaxis protein CheW